MQSEKILIRERDMADEIPYDLLLLADPDRDQIDTYLPTSIVYVLKINQDIQGICVLVYVNSRVMEIKNVAIAEELQGLKLGTRLLKYVIEQVKKRRGVEKLLIKTANSSINQIGLYQKLGFDLKSIHHNHFCKHYPEPIWENGIQAKHQIVFEMKIH